MCVGDDKESSLFLTPLQGDLQVDFALLEDESLPLMNERFALRCVGQISELDMQIKLPSLCQTMVNNTNHPSVLVPNPFALTYCQHGAGHLAPSSHCLTNIGHFHCVRMEYLGSFRCSGHHVLHYPAYSIFMQFARHSAQSITTSLSLPH